MQLAETDHDGWTARFEALGQRKRNLAERHLSEVELEAEMHRVSLIRAVLEWADGTEDIVQHKFSQTLSAYANLVEFADLLGPMVSSTMVAMSESQGVDDVSKFTEQIPRDVPMAPRVDCKAIPANLAYRVRLDTINSYLSTRCVDTQTIQGPKLTMTRAEVYRQMPFLQSRENDMHLLVCHGAKERTPDEALCRWAASADAQLWSQRTITGLRGVQARTQAILSLSALYHYRLLLPCSPSEHLAHSNPASLFNDLLLNGTVQHQCAVLERMILSVRRVFGTCCPSALRGFLAVQKWQTRPHVQDAHVADGLSDHYWGAKLDCGLSHEDAWEQARSQYDDATNNGWNSLSSVQVIKLSPSKKKTDFYGMKFADGPLRRAATSVAALTVVSLILLHMGRPYEKIPAIHIQVLLGLPTAIVGGVSYWMRMRHGKRRQGHNDMRLLEEGVIHSGAGSASAAPGYLAGKACVPSGDTSPQ